jgi:hypothetical protein
MAGIMVQVVVGGVVMGTLVASPKTFSTGSTGFFASGKIQMPDGTRLQASVNLVTIGSKPAAK